MPTVRVTNSYVSTLWGYSYKSWDTLDAVSYQKGSVEPNQSIDLQVPDDYFQLEVEDGQGNKLAAPGPLYHATGVVTIKNDGSLHIGWPRSGQVFEGKARWMEASAAVQGRTLRQICLPMSHDSATSNLSNVFVQDSSAGIDSPVLTDVLNHLVEISTAVGAIGFWLGPGRVITAIFSGSPD